MCRRLKRRALLGKADRALGLLHPPSQRLVLGLPRGYVLKPSGEIALDPDEGVRQVIGLVFAVFERRRSVSRLLRYLVDHDIQLPDRVRAGPDKGEVRWNRPNRATLSDMLRHPAYAGAVRPEL